METYEMVCLVTGEVVLCYWYEALSLKDKGWKEVSRKTDNHYWLGLCDE